MSFIKQIMAIGSENNSFVTEHAANITGEFDIDNLAGQLNFTLPYYLSIPNKQEGYAFKTAVKDLKKFDTIKLYANYFDSNPGQVEQSTSNGELVFTANGKQLIQIFDGYIDQIKQQTSKTNINYEITGLGTIGISNDRGLEYQHQTGTALELFPTLLQLAGLQIGDSNVIPVTTDIIPINKIRFIDVNAGDRVIITDGGQSLKDILDNIKEKYSFIIHQSGDGYLNIMTPFYLLQNSSDNILSVNSWNFDINDGNVFEIDYGDLTNQYNAVVVVGLGVHGVAVDPISVQNNNGIINYITIENRSSQSEEQCQELARNKLLEILRNQIISFKTIFHPEFMVGQPFTINDNDRFDGSQIFTLKKFSFNISKTDVSCNVQGFLHGTATIPSDLLLSNTGILDVDVLQIRDKELDTTKWNDI